MASLIYCPNFACGAEIPVDGESGLCKECGSKLIVEDGHRDRLPTPGIATIARGGRRSARRIVISLRLLIALTLLIGGSLGWVVHRARVQREAVAAIIEAGGSVRFDWEWEPDDSGPRPGRTGPGVPSWLLKGFGPDYFQTVRMVSLIEDVENGTSDEVMISVGRLDGLSQLQIRTTDLTDAGLEPLKNLTKLHRLSISTPKATGASLSNLAGMTQLTHLGLQVPVTKSDLARLASLPSLKSLELRCKGLDDAGLSHLAALKGLERLDLSDQPITDAGLIHLSGLTNLLTLGLSSTKITTLEPIRNLTKLRELAVGKNELDDAGLAAVEGFHDLYYLWLTESKITDAGLDHVSPLPKMQALVLNGTQITDAGLAKMVEAPGPRYAMESIYLRETEVTDAGLANLSKMPGLRIIDLRNSRVSNFGLAYLQQVLPNAKVRWP